nr:AraC family transcriptional regulator [uncultured Moellerella sp.]
MHSGKINSLFPCSDSAFFCGKFTPEPGEWTSEPLWKGIKLILMMNGELECKPDNQRLVSLSGPSLCVITNYADQESQQRFLQQQDVHYISICLSELLLDKFEIQPSLFLTSSQQREPQFFSQQAGNVLTTLGHQILNSPLQGPLGDMYLAGKVLELCAFSFDQIQHSSQSIDHPKLSSADIARLHEVRQIILTNLAEPPGMYQLSRQSGLNMRKLNFGFKQLFGASVTAFIQEERLQFAYRLLATGGEPVSVVAWKIGYSPAYFSTTFKKRFGFSPKQLN